MRDGVDLSRLPDRLIRLQATLRVNQVRREDGVDQRRLSKTRLTCRHIWRVKIHVLRPYMNSYCVPATMTLNWKPRFKSLCSICCVMVSKPT